MTGRRGSQRRSAPGRRRPQRRDNQPQVGEGNAVRLTPPRQKQTLLPQAKHGKREAKRPSGWATRPSDLQGRQRAGQVSGWALRSPSARTDAAGSARLARPRPDSSGWSASTELPVRQQETSRWRSSRAPCCTHQSPPGTAGKARGGVLGGHQPYGKD